MLLAPLIALLLVGQVKCSAGEGGGESQLQANGSASELALQDTIADLKWLRALPAPGAQAEEQLIGAETNGQLFASDSIPGQRRLDSDLLDSQQILENNQLLMAAARQLVSAQAITNRRQLNRQLLGRRAQPERRSHDHRSGQRRPVGVAGKQGQRVGGGQRQPARRQLHRQESRKRPARPLVDRRARDDIFDDDDDDVERPNAPARRRSDERDDADEQPEGAPARPAKSAGRKVKQRSPDRSRSVGRNERDDDESRLHALSSMPADPDERSSASQLSQSASDLQTAAGHQHGHHGLYYQYVEVPKKKAWKFGFKRGNHKHEIEKHEKGHKHKFHTEFKWHAKEKCKKKKKCKSVGKMTWEYKHAKKHHH